MRNMLSSVLPPSPALSYCESLADIDDLDAFLESQGRLTHFPTPPVKSESLVECVETHGDDHEYLRDNVEGIQVATLLADEACVSDLASPQLIDIIHEFLVRANLPLELLALALNILTKFSISTTPEEDRVPELLLISALALATSYNSDNPPTLFSWASDVTDGVLEARDIDSSTLRILVVLDWRLHSICSPEQLEQGMLRLQALKKTTSAAGLTGQSPPEPAELSKQLKLEIDGTLASWSNGLLTPGETPPTSALETPVDRWLRLL